MSKQYLNGEFENSRAYSKAVAATGGTTVYLAGVGSPFGEGGKVNDFAAQAHGCFAAMKTALAEFGGTISDIVTMTVFITDMSHGHDFVAIRKEYFPDGKFPGSALIGISELAKSEMLVEVQAIAVVGAQ